MIVNNDYELEYYRNLTICFNKQIDKNHHKIIKDSIESAFSSSIYIDNIYLDIVTIVYNITKNHYFEDGNKRTALAMLENLSELYDLKITDDDESMKDLMLDLTTDTITKEDFIKYIFV